MTRATSSCRAWPPSFCFSSSAPPRAPYPFPTRRSSDLRCILGHPTRRRTAGHAAGIGHDVGNVLADGLRCNAVLFVVGHLPGAPALGLAYGALHGAGHVVGIKNGLAALVAGRPADGLRSEERR